MNGDNKKERAALGRLADRLVDDVLKAPDAEILAEFREAHGDPETHALEMRAQFEKSLIARSKQRLAAAKASVAAIRQSGTSASAPVNIAAARARLRAVLNSPGAPAGLTLAARNEGELSDADVVGMLDDLAELGVLPLNSKEPDRKS